MKRRSPLVALLAFTLAPAVALAQQEPPPPDAELLCVPGQQITCACPGGVSGVQACRGDGAAYEVCQCGPLGPPMMLPPGPPLGPPEVLPYEEGDPIPVGYRHERRARRGWLAAGLSVSLGLYLVGGVVASVIDAGGPPRTCDENGCRESLSHQALFVPLVGPFITAATPPDERNDTWTFLLVADGVLQVAGAFSAVASFVWAEERLERIPSFQLLPMAGSDGAGLAMQGSF
jgi:hypothetical protein